MRSILTTALLALTVVGAGTAYASGTVPKIVGHKGPHIQLDQACKRAVVPAPGGTLEMSVNVLGQQVHCLIRRPDPFAWCVRQLGDAPTVEGKFDHGDGKPGDWSGVDKLQAYVQAVSNCADYTYYDLPARRS